MPRKSSVRRGIGFVLVVTVAAIAAAGLTRLPEALARVDAFRVTDLTVEGARYLEEAEAVRWSGVPAGASVWDDPTDWERRLRAHPLVEDVEVGRELPGTLVFSVREKKPVALHPGPTIAPVDGHGDPLPIDPSLHPIDLPVIRPRVIEAGRELTPAELRGVAHELDRLRRVDPRFLASISDVAVGPQGDFVARLVDSDVRVRFRPPLTTGRLREAMQALSHARSTAGGVRQVDLRFEDQVVVALTEEGGR